MDVNKTDVVAPIGSGGPKKEEKRGTDEEQREKNHDTEVEDSGTSPWEGTEAPVWGAATMSANKP